MKRFYFLALMVAPFMLQAQLNSDVLVNGNDNQVSVKQNGDPDAIFKVKVAKGDRNKIIVDQQTTVRQEKTSRLMGAIHNSYYIVELLISVPTIVGAVYFWLVRRKKRSGQLVV